MVGEGDIQSPLPSAGRGRGVSLRGARGGRSLRRDREDGKAVIWAFLGRRGEPRKRPGPDVIGHQLTVLWARAPRLQPRWRRWRPPQLRHLQPGSGWRRPRSPCGPRPWSPCAARCGGPPRCARVCPERPGGFVRIRAPERGGRETRAPAGGWKCPPRLLLLDLSSKQGGCLRCDAAGGAPSTPPGWCSKDSAGSCLRLQLLLLEVFCFLARKLALPKDAPVRRTERRSSLPRPGLSESVRRAAYGSWLCTCGGPEPVPRREPRRHRPARPAGARGPRARARPARCRPLPRRSARAVAFKSWGVRTRSGCQVPATPTPPPVPGA